MMHPQIIQIEMFGFKAQIIEIVCEPKNIYYAVFDQTNVSTTGIKGYVQFVEYVGFVLENLNA